MKAPRSWVWRLAGEFLPSPWGVALVLVAGALVAAELALASLIGLLVFTAKDGPTMALDLHDMLFAGLVGPIVVALLWLAALLPNRTGFRAVLLLGTAAVIAAAGTSCAISAKHVDPKGGMLVAGLVTYIPALLGTLIVAFGALVAVPLQVRRTGERASEEWLADRIRNGAVLATDAATALGQTEAWIHDVAINLVADGLLDLRHTDGWLVSRDQVAIGMASIVAACQARARLPIPELLSTVELPEALGRPWLDELAADPSVPLTIDRDADVILWDIAVSHGQMTWCPRCGGPEHLAGGRLVRCSGCSWEREP
jgi:hypothetical protein